MLGAVTVCAAGYWKSEVGNASCTACPAGRTTLALGSVSEAACACDAGFEPQPNGTCRLCPPSFVKLVEGSSSCLSTTVIMQTWLPLCLASGVALSPGQTTAVSTSGLSLGTCTAAARDAQGSVVLASAVQDANASQLCAEGWLPVTGLCVPCPIGSYRSASNISCIPCRPGATTQHAASISPVQCQCNRGFERTPSSCVACADSMFKSDIGDFKCTFSAACPDGTFVATNVTSTSSRICGACAVVGDCAGNQFLVGLCRQDGSPGPVCANTTVCPAGTRL